MFVCEKLFILLKLDTSIYEECKFFYKRHIANFLQNILFRFIFKARLSLKLHVLLQPLVLFFESEAQSK